jgi:hypothetical protein
MMRHQAAAAPPHGSRPYNAAINAAYREHTVDDMVSRAVIRCRGRPLKTPETTLV